MDDRTALFNAVCAHPNEDTPRLALADWFQEQGDREDRARAVLIRTQIEQDRGDLFGCLRGSEPRSLFTPRCRCRSCTFTRRAREVLKRYRDKWCRLVQAAFGPGAIAWLSRGFVGGVRTSKEDFVANAGRAFASNPISDVQLTHVAPAEVYGLPEFGGQFAWIRKDEALQDDACFVLPAVLFDRLPGQWATRRGMVLKLFTSVRVAEMNLKLTCLEFGRAERKQHQAAA